MKMIKCFAVEPKALNGWEQFRYVMEKFSFSQGRVVAKLPRGWIKELLSCLDGVGDIERQRFVEKLRRYKEDRFVSVGDSGGGTWVNRAKYLRERGVVDEILISTETALLDKEFPGATPDIVDEKFFEVHRERRCEATLENLVAAAELFLAQSLDITLVDPYFFLGRPGNSKVLGAFIKAACSGKRCRRFTVVTEKETKPKGGEEFFVRFAEGELSEILPQDFTLRMAFLDKKKPGCDFHARYLLATMGGLRYDKGFHAPGGSEKTDISLLDWSLFCEVTKWLDDKLSNHGDMELWTWSKS